MKRNSLKFNECCRIRFRWVILTGLFLLCMHSGSKAQTRLNSIDGVYIERTNRVDLSTSIDSAGKVTEVIPYFISETNIGDGDVIAINIHGFSDYMRENKKLLKNVILKIDQVELPEFPAYIENADSDVVRFKVVNRNLKFENRKLLYKLPGTSTKEVLLGLKIDESTVLTFNEPGHIWFKEIQQRGKFGWILIVAFFLFFALLIFRYQSVIKESVSNFTNNLDVKTYFSFSKSQYAFWTFIVIASFIYIWAFTGDLNSINNTALILLGITSATIVTGNLITKNEEDKAVLDNKVDVLLTNKIKGPKEKSNFLEDILSDADGISINRLQALVFNMVFGIAFIQTVLSNYAMPEFSATQLILLGLSNGTYAFLKNLESK